jgi:sulfide:quinone oxidoreductase
MNYEITRREALKLLGTSGLLLNSTQTSANDNFKYNTSKVKIVIIGGGIAGIATASKLSQQLDQAKITILEPNKDSTQYQEGYTFLASGIWEKDDVIYKRDDFIPRGVTLIKEKAVEFNPDYNTITTDNGRKLKYDFLVVAAGVKLNYSAIKGLEEVGEAYSTGDNTLVSKILTSLNVSSVYTINSAEDTWKNIQQLVENGKKNKNLNALFTTPNTQIKAAGVSFSMMNMVYSRLKQSSLHTHTQISYYTSNNFLLPIKKYNENMIEKLTIKNIDYFYKHNLTQIKNNQAIFNNNIKQDFNFLHITPPMKAPDELGKSLIGSKDGWIPVDKESLQHLEYKNIFALGDIANIPFGKTAGSIRKQYPIVVNNILSIIKNGKISKTNLKYDGYTIYSILTGIETAMFIQFDLSKNNYPDAMKQRYIWWLFKLYLSKPLTMYGLLKARL